MLDFVSPAALAVVAAEGLPRPRPGGPAPGGLLAEAGVAEDGRGGPPAVRRPPEKVLAVERPPLGQARFHRDAVPVRPARFRPIANWHASWTLCRQGARDGHESSHDEATFSQQMDCPVLQIRT